MKKILTSIFLLLSFLSFSQIRPTFQYGLKAGISDSKTAIINNRTNILSRFRNDVNFGVFYRYNHAKFSVQPEVYFQVKGGSFKSTSTNFAETGNSILRNNYQYVDASVMLGYEFAKNVHFVVGPEYGWALNAGAKRGPYAHNDFSIATGLRIDMLDIAHLASLNIRYVHGLTNTTNKTYTLADKSVIPLDFRNRTLQVSATFTVSDFLKAKKMRQKK